MPPFASETQLGECFKDGVFLSLNLGWMAGRAGEMIPEVGGGGLGPGGSQEKGSLSVAKGPKLPIQLFQLLKNSQREVKRAHYCYILGPPRSHPGYGIDGAQRGRSFPVPPPPGFSSHDDRVFIKLKYATSITHKFC